MSRYFVPVLTINEACARLRECSIKTAPDTLAQEIEEGNYPEFAQCIRRPGSTTRTVRIFAVPFEKWLRDRAIVMKDGETEEEAMMRLRTGAPQWGG